MGESIDMAEARKRVRKTGDKITDAAVQATDVTQEAAAPIVEANAAIADNFPAQIEQKIEAASSPAVDSDPVPEAAKPSPIIERIMQMATVSNPTEGFDKGQAMIGDASARFKTAFEKSSKMGEDMVEFAKGNVEAVVASARVAAKAGESLGQEAADYSKKHLESATALFKSFATVKSPTELFQLQSDFAKSAFDMAVAEASRVGESMMKAAGEIAQPLSSRYAVAAEKFKAPTL